MNKTRDERVEFLKFHLKEIDEAAVRVGEDEVLLDEKKILNSIQKLTEYARDRPMSPFTGKPGRSRKRFAAS